MKLDDFLSHIHRNLGPDEVVVTVSAHEGWKARRYRPGDQVSLNSLYFCISTVRNIPRQNVLPRTTDALMRAYVIVLDDIGTKVDPAKVKLQPSYKLETSPGNFQWGYLLTYGSDPAKAAALIQGLADAGLTDEGAKRADRVVRVPGSINEKPTLKEPFIARLVEKHWDRQWTLSELELGLGVTSIEPRPAMDHIKALEAGETDPVFVWLQDDDRVLEGPNPRGWYDIVCPWEEEHTTDHKGSTSYMPGRPGAFSCLHGHCQAAGRNTAALKAWIREQDPTAVLERTMADVAAGLREELGKKAPDVLAGLAEQARAWRLINEARHPDEPLEDPQAVRKAVLQDLIHVASENKYWSVEIGALLQHQAINDRWYRRMFLAGLLDGFTPAGKETIIQPAAWLRGRNDVRRAGKLVHRLGQPLIVDGDLNIAPELPYDCGDIVGDPQPWLDVVSFVCCGDESDIEWMLDWMALVVGKFSVKPGWHLLIKGKQGTGKNLMMLPLVSYLKPHHQADVTPKVLTGEFTTFLEKRLCCIDEMKTTTRGSSTGHDVYNTLKAYTAIGADTIAVRAMYKSPYEASNLSCWVLTSNETVPLPVEDDDRRFFVIETPRVPMPKEWYDERVRWIEANTQVVIGWLQRRWKAMDDIDRRGLRGRAPMTQAKLELIDSSASGIDGAVRLLIAGKHGEPVPDLMRMEDVMAKLEVSKLMAQSLKGHLTVMRVTDALKMAGAIKLFGGSSIPSKKGGTMRVWCVRGEKKEEYEALGYKGVTETYAEQHGGKIDNIGMKSNVAPFKRP